MTFIDYIQHHPVIALAVGLTHLAVAEVLTHSEVPVIIMQSFQIGAWSTTIIVGLITIYGALKKLFKK
jgi:hypothetical protein